MERITILTICFLTLFFSCKKNIGDSDFIALPYKSTVNYSPQVENITSSVLGIVVDEAGAPIEDAKVTIGNTTQMTSPFGTFRFEEITMNKKGTFVEIEKQGYFKSGRRFFPHTVTSNNVRVELLEKTFDQTFQSEVGGTITFEDGGEINFSPHSIITQSGHAYTGTINVARKWLDPTAPSTIDQMPGGLLGVTQDGEEMGLETYGMIGVELEGENGEPLNIKLGHTAEIKMPIPQELLNNAPTEIPLWSFDYKYGIWVEEEKAILQDGFYIGEVKHFSFWNCDFPRPVVSLSFTIVDAETLDPLSGIPTNIIINSSGLTGTGISNDDGFVTGLVPIDFEFELQILNYCDEVIYTQNIGPFTDDTDLGTIEIPFLESTIIYGQMKDCNAEMVVDGFVVFEIGNYVFVRELDSNPFSFSILKCSEYSEMTVYGVDYNSLQQGDGITFTCTDSVHLGTLIAACGQSLILNYMEITLDGVAKTLVPLSSQFQYLDPNGIPNGTGLYFTNDNPSQRIRVRFDGVTAGSHSDILGSFAIGNNTWFEDLNFRTHFRHFEITITEYGENPGDIISGYFSEPMLNWLAPQDSTLLEGKFRIIRDF